MPNLKLTKKQHLSAFRKIALGTWQTAYDPSVYGSVAIRVDPALAYMQAFREATGKRLTITHMVARAVAEALRVMPDANAIVRWNTVYLRERIGVFLQVAMTDEGEEKIDLSGATLYDVEQKTLLALCEELEQKVAAVRTRSDPALEGTRKNMQRVPAFLMNLVLKVVSFVHSTLNLDLSGFGIPSDPFGSVMITNIGSLGLESAYVPLVPYSRVPILLALGAIADEAVVEDGAIIPRKMLRIHATFDHRVFDGAHAAKMVRVLRDWLEHPFERFDPIAASAPSA